MLNNDVNMNLVNWEDLFCTVVNEFVPQKRINDKFTPSWIDKEVKALCRRIEPAERRCEQRRVEILIILNPWGGIRRKYIAYLNQLADNIQDNPKKFWSFYSAKIKTRKLPFTAIKKNVNSNLLVTVEKANLFNN